MTDSISARITLLTDEVFGSLFCARSIRFGSLGDLCGVSKHEGYQGGLRLMQASCKMFFE